MQEEWRYILPMTGMALVASTWQIVETPFNLRSAEIDPKPVGMSYDHRQPFLPEGHQEGKSGPPPKVVVAVASSSWAVNWADTLPNGVTIEELPGFYRVRVPWWWPPKA